MLFGSQYSKITNPNDAYRKGYLIGYREGYQDGICGKPNISYEINNDINFPIEALGLSTRAFNCLYCSGCRYIADVVRMDKKNILRIRNLGKITAAEIAHALINCGITGTDWEFFLL